MARDFTDILNAVWAANALTTIPNPPIPGQAYRNTEIDDSNLENGQQYSEVYDSARYNQLLYLLSGCLKMLMETGLPEWSAEQNYQQNAYTIGSDGKLYGPAKKASGPDNGGAVDPVTDAAGEATTWALLLPDFEAPLAFDAAEGKVKLSVGNTTTVTADKLEVKVDPNGGLQGTTNGIVIKPVASGPVTVDANGINVSTFTAPTASEPGNAGLVPGPQATAPTVQLANILTMMGWGKFDPAAIMPSIAGDGSNTLGLGAESAEGVNIDTLLRTGFFAATSFSGTLPPNTAGGILINLFAAASGLYYGQQILMSLYGNTWCRSNNGGITAGGTPSWTAWQALGAPKPQAAEGVGQWRTFGSSSGAGGQITVPSGGVWAYFLTGVNAINDVPDGTIAGVAAGGTVLTVVSGSGAPVSNVWGFCWRIA